MNPVTTYIEEHINQLLTRNPHLSRLGQSRFIYHNQQDERIIPILSGGGSGHEPAHFGYIGQGMLAGAVAGDLFCPPTTDEILRAIRFLNKGKGVFVIIKNFEADLAVFQQAMTLAREEGISVASVISQDDVSVDTADFKRRHRGVAGTLFLHKILGQAALMGANLATLKQLGQDLSKQIATLGVAIKPTRDLVINRPLFELKEGYISYGVGIHGEAGYRTVPYKSLEKLAVELVNKLKMFFRWQKGQTFALLVNNLGEAAVDKEEQFLRHLLELLALEELTIVFAGHGKLMTSLNMGGLSVSLCHLADESWIDYLQASTNAPAWVQSLTISNQGS